mmetsp:Transcript_1331/g.2826  ORF Transcript_1331/g.2826 Transcript_1331/m.2826 type:complete len:135 (-) Transcript_1331:65-469(-)
MPWEQQLIVAFHEACCNGLEDVYEALSEVFTPTLSELRRGADLANAAGFSSLANRLIPAPRQSIDSLPIRHPANQSPEPKLSLVSGSDKPSVSMNDEEVVSQGEGQDEMRVPSPMSSLNLKRLSSADSRRIAFS